MGTREREMRRAMLKRRGVPRHGRMAPDAVVGETRRHMVGVLRLPELFLVTLLATIEHELEIPGGMTQLAGNRLMCSREKKAPLFVLPHHVCAQPGLRHMAPCAGFATLTLVHIRVTRHAHGFLKRKPKRLVA